MALFYENCLGFLKMFAHGALLAVATTAVMFHEYDSSGSSLGLALETIYMSTTRFLVLQNSRTVDFFIPRKDNSFHKLFAMARPSSLNLGPPMRPRHCVGMLV